MTDYVAAAAGWLAVEWIDDDTILGSVKTLSPECFYEVFPIVAWVMCERGPGEAVHRASPVIFYPSGTLPPFITTVVSPNGHTYEDGVFSGHLNDLAHDKMIAWRTRRAKKPPRTEKTPLHPQST